MTSVIYPPTIVASPNTPAEEWAQQTTTVVNNVGDERDQVQESTSDPRHQEPPLETSGIPGSYPGIISDYDAERLKENTKEALAAASETAQELYERAGQAAKEYIPIAQQTVNEASRTVYGTAQQVARQYLPESILGTLEQVGVLGSTRVKNDTRPVPYTSMPTDEVGPFHPTHGGVGVLPGLPDEEGVAKLPDERLEELREQLPTRETQTGSTRGGVGSLPGTRSETSVAKLPEERLQDEGQASPNRLDQLRGELPSKEVDTGPTHGGVGTLPGSRSESGVVVLPEERRTDAKAFKPSESTTPSPLDENAGSTDTRNSLEGSREKPSQEILPLTEVAPASNQPPVPLKIQKHVLIDDNNINGIMGQETRGTGAGLHSVDPAKPNTVVGGDLPESPTSDDKDKDRNKTSLTKKLKANAKIIGGKITRDKELVEEGKSLKTGN